MQNNNKNFKLLWSSDSHYGQSHFELSTEKSDFLKKKWEQYLNNPKDFYLCYEPTGDYFNHEDSIKLIHCYMCTAVQINNYERYCSACEYFPHYSKITEKIRNDEYEWGKRRNE